MLGYAGARETDKRSLAREALDRYRELNLIYDLADEIGAVLETDAIAAVAVAEASRLPTGGLGFVMLLTEDRGRLDRPPDDRSSDAPIVEHDATDGILGAILAGDPEIVNDIAGDPRATALERAFASVVAAPLRVRGERIGVIGTISRDPIEYYASDLRLLGAIASLAAPTFDQAATMERHSVVSAVHDLARPVRTRRSAAPTRTPRLSIGTRPTMDRRAIALGVLGSWPCWRTWWRVARVAIGRGRACRDPACGTRAVRRGRTRPCRARCGRPSSRPSRPTSGPNGRTWISRSASPS